MATYYVDNESGNDSNNGTTFALRKKTFSGLSVTGGDEVRLKASPAATSVGQNATWTNNSYLTTASALSATSSAATPVVVTTASNHGYSTGDTVTITGSPSTVSALGTWKITVTGATTFTLDTSTGVTTGSSLSVWNITASTVYLTTAVSQPIASTANNRTAWTGGANVTRTLQNNNGKYGGYCDQLAVNATFTTGTIGYKELPTASTNLSDYRQVSFWMKQTSGTLLSTGNMKLELCSDTLGATAVNTLDVPAIGVTGAWHCFAIDFGGQLSASVSSVRLRLTVDQGAQTFQMSNIIACLNPANNDSIVLNSLIGKNDDEWYSVGAMDGTRIVLDGYQNSGSTSVHFLNRYSGTSESVTLYKRQATITDYAASAVFVLPTINGSSGNPVTISGGWNRTDMSTQTDVTYFSSTAEGKEYCFYSNNFQYVDVSKLGGRGYISPWVAAPTVAGTFTDCNFQFESLVSSNSGVIFQTTSGLNLTLTANLIAGCINGFNSSTTVDINNVSIDRISGCNNGVGVSGRVKGTISTIENCVDAFTGSSGLFDMTFTNIKNCGAVSRLTGAPTLRNGTVTNCQGSTTLNHKFESVTFTNNTSVEIGTTINSGPRYFNNCTFTSTPLLLTNIVNNPNPQWNFMITNQSSAEMHLHTGKISTDTTTRHTASGYSWKYEPSYYITQTNSLAATETFPLENVIARIAVSANNLVTFKAWLRRSNANVVAKIVCKGRQIAGVTSNVSASITAAADTWEEVTITFTPTASGVVEITGQAYPTVTGTVYSAWIDDLTITQA